MQTQYACDPTSGFQVNHQFRRNAGLVCLLIFRGLAGIPYGPIWDWELYISAVDYRHILLGKQTCI